MTAAPVLSRAIDAGGNPVLVGPDGESRQWVEAIAEPLGLSVIVGAKRRGGDREVEIAFERADEVAGRGVVLIDDVISSGATLEQAARLLRKAGATGVEALATHCLASAAEIDLLKQAGIDRIRSTDSVAGPTATITLVELLADEIRKRDWSN